MGIKKEGPAVCSLTAATGPSVVCSTSSFLVPGIVPVVLEDPGRYIRFLFWPPGEPSSACLRVQGLPPGRSRWPDTTLRADLRRITELWRSARNEQQSLPWLHGSFPQSNDHGYGCSEAAHEQAGVEPGYLPHWSMPLDRGLCKSLFFRIREIKYI